MSAGEHKQNAPVSASCFILTVSDTRSVETDVSGQTLRSLMVDGGHTVAGHTIVKDDRSAITAAISRALTTPGIDAIVITGGTGVAPRDVTIEAVESCLEKVIPGFGELFRALSFKEIGSAAMLSRATAGVAQGRLVFACPGSTGAVRLAMTQLILPELGHLLRETRRVR